MKLAIIGCGNLGTAIVRAVLAQPLVGAPDLQIIERDSSKHAFISREFGLTALSAPTAAAASCDIILVAVKPQDALQALESLSPYLKPSQLIVSVMAGITVAAIREMLHSEAVVVRAMPNLASQVRLGVTGYFLGGAVSPPQMQNIERILESFGCAIRLPEEGAIDAMTAVSASGPAYFFYFVEHLLAAARELGLSELDAQAAVLGTMEGSLELLRKGDRSAEELRKQVTSPNGTTAAALKVFEQGRLGQVLREGVLAAFRRAGELSR